jgi:cupin superfamily acireductone dioxygenase involved in methionine salvage
MDSIMTPIESIYEIESKLFDFQPHLHSREVIVAREAMNKYEQLVDRFFKEHVSVLDSEQRYICLDNDTYFSTLMKSTIETYYSGHEYSP